MDWMRCPVGQVFPGGWGRILGGSVRRAAPRAWGRILGDSVQRAAPRAWGRILGDSVQRAAPGAWGRILGSLVRLVALAALTCILGLSTLVPCLAAAESDAVAPTDLFNLVYGKKFEEVLEIAAEELGAPGTSADRKMEILRATATVHLLRYLESGEEESRNNAHSTMLAMLRLDQSTDFVPGYRYPPPVHEMFQEVRMAWLEGSEEPAAPTRVAVAPFYLIDLGAGGKFDWQAFADALPFIITTDLEAIPGLTLLCREHMEAIRSELTLSSQAELVSAENRIKLRQLLSATSFIYGEVQALPGDEIWLELRWVQTETGAILLARHEKKRVRKGSDLLKLEQKVVVEDFIPAMLEMLGHDEGRQAAKQAREHFKRKISLASRGDTYLDYVAAVARATLAEEAGNSEEALRYWRTASKALPKYEAPRDKVRALELLAEKVREAGDRKGE